MERKVLLDVEQELKTSKNKFLRNLPKPAVWLLKRTIKEKELNEIYFKYKDLWGMDFVKALLFEEFKVTVKFVEQGTIEQNKRYIYIANHPLGAIDALAHLYLVYKHHGNVVSPSNELFEYIPNLSPVILGINVFGMNSKQKTLELNKLFESDKQVMMFPAGEVSRLIKGKIRDPQWKKTFVTKAVQYKRDIVPSFITGRNSAFFYFIAKMRKLLGIKLYVETALLPAEMLKQYEMDITFVVLEPISWQQIKESGKSHQWWCDHIYKLIYKAGKEYLDKTC